MDVGYTNSKTMYTNKFSRYVCNDLTMCSSSWFMLSLLQGLLFDAIAQLFFKFGSIFLFWMIYSFRGKTMGYSC